MGQGKSNGGSAPADVVRDQIAQCLSGESFGVAELTRIVQIAEAGKALLAATSTEVDPALLRRRGAFQTGQLNVNPVYSPSTTEIGFGGASLGAESYGARVMRDIQAILPKLLGQRAKYDLVRAIAYAKEEIQDPDLRNAVIEPLMAELTGKQQTSEPVEEQKS